MLQFEVGALQPGRDLVSRIKPLYNNIIYLFNNCPLSPLLRRFLAVEQRLRRRPTRAIVCNIKKREKS